jgi:hypothetical protein
VTKLKEELAAPLRVMQEIARRIAKVSKESKLAINEDDYVSSFKVELMDAVVQWCRGASFAEICKVRLLQLMVGFGLTIDFCSSLTSLRVVSSESSGVSESSFGRWHKLPKSLAIRSSKKSSKRLRRCLKDPILLFSARPYIYKVHRRDQTAVAIS